MGSTSEAAVSCSSLSRDALKSGDRHDGGLWPSTLLPQTERVVLSIREARPGRKHAAVWLKDLQIWKEKKPGNQHLLGVTRWVSSADTISTWLCLLTLWPGWSQPWECFYSEKCLLWTLFYSSTRIAAQQAKCGKYSVLISPECSTTCFLATTICFVNTSMQKAINYRENGSNLLFFPSFCPYIIVADGWHGRYHTGIYTESKFIWLSMISCCPTDETDNWPVLVWDQFLMNHRRTGHVCW